MKRTASEKTCCTLLAVLVAVVCHAPNAAHGGSGAVAPVPVGPGETWNSPGVQGDWYEITIKTDGGTFHFAGHDGDHISHIHFYQVSAPFPTNLTVRSADFGFDDWGWVVTPEKKMYILGANEKDDDDLWDGYSDTLKAVARLGEIEYDNIAGRSVDLWVNGTFNNPLGFSRGGLSRTTPNFVAEAQKNDVFPAGSVLYVTSSKGNGLENNVSNFQDFLDQARPPVTKPNGALGVGGTQRVQGRIKIGYQLWAAGTEAFIGDPIQTPPGAPRLTFTVGQQALDTAVGYRRERVEVTNSGDGTASAFRVLVSGADAQYPYISPYMSGVTPDGRPYLQINHALAPGETYRTYLFFYSHDGLPMTQHSYSVEVTEPAEPALVTGRVLQGAPYIDGGTVTNYEDWVAAPLTPGGPIMEVEYRLPYIGAPRYEPVILDPRPLDGYGVSYLDVSEAYGIADPPRGTVLPIVPKRAQIQYRAEGETEWRAATGLVTFLYSGQSALLAWDYNFQLTKGASGLLPAEYRWVVVD